MKIYYKWLLHETQQRLRELDAAVRTSADRDPLRFALGVASAGFAAGVFLRLHQTRVLQRSNLFI